MAKNAKNVRTFALSEVRAFTLVRG